MVRGRRSSMSLGSRSLPNYPRLQYVSSKFVGVYVFSYSIILIHVSAVDDVESSKHDIIGATVLSKSTTPITVSNKFTGVKFQTHHAFIFHALVYLL